MFIVLNLGYINIEWIRWIFLKSYQIRSVVFIFFEKEQTNMKQIYIDMSRRWIEKIYMRIFKNSLLIICYDTSSNNLYWTFSFSERDIAALHASWTILGLIREIWRFLDNISNLFNRCSGGLGNNWSEVWRRIGYT